MELSSQVCSLEQAKRLRELGVPQNGMFWRNIREEAIFCQINPSKIGMDKDYAEAQGTHEPYHNNNLYAMFTASEIGEMLPSESGVICWAVHYNDHLGVWNCEIRDLVKWEGGGTIPPVAYESEGDTMAECMADALIHCLENKLVNPSQSTNQ